MFLKQSTAHTFRFGPFVDTQQPLLMCTQLTFLRLENNQLTDVTGLEKLTQLTELYLNDNQLTELPKGLEKLTQLESLDLTSNPDLTKAQIDQLKQALPNCNITH